MASLDNYDNAFFTLILNSVRFINAFVFACILNLVHYVIAFKARILWSIESICIKSSVDCLWLLTDYYLRWEIMLRSAH